MKAYWEPTNGEIWQGRNDLEESLWAKRMFQTVQKETEFIPEKYPEQIALLGFACDEGVKINKGRTGAKEAPVVLRKALANFASHRTDPLIDLGNIIGEGNLQENQTLFSDSIIRCQKNKMKTLVIGGGHETAFAHGLGIYKANPDATIGIINFDAHLDIRTNKETSSGTPFLQLADYCKEAGRDFNYLCVGVSKAANTQALLQTAKELDVKIIWDIDCTHANIPSIQHKIQEYINSVDIIYLTIDLDVLPPGIMFAVSAPSSLGVEPNFLYQLLLIIMNSGKLRGADVVEFNPSLDRDMLCARIAARFLWQIYHDWK